MIRKKINDQSAFDYATTILPADKRKTGDVGKSTMISNSTVNPHSNNTADGDLSRRGPNLSPLFDANPCAEISLQTLILRYNEST